MTVTLLPLRTAFSASDWFVAPTNLTTGNRLVETYHYARGASPNAVFLHGLFLRGDFLNCYGVAWWIPAIKGSVDKYNAGRCKTSLVLHRLVVHPIVPTNGASFLLGRSIRQITRAGTHDMLITYADTWRKHTGAIYFATNWDYLGLTDPLPIWVDSAGRQVSTSSRLTGVGGKRSKNPSTRELREKGYQMIGRYSKHVFVMRLKLKPSRLARRLSLFDEQEL